jgi:hypothetical protein
MGDWPTAFSRHGVWEQDTAFARISRGSLQCEMSSPAYVGSGSVASDRYPRDAGAMFAFTPIASKHWKRSETTRCASSGHAFALGDDWIVRSADYRAAVLELPPRMARCASKSFATPQSCFISIKVVAVGQQTRTNVDCINREFAGFLALGGFAWRKK